MPELNIDLDYFEHPKVELLVERLGEWAEILPIRLWRFAARFHAESGVISGPSVLLIERHLNWRGKKGEAVEALVACGFLDPIDGGGYLVHDFLEHQGHIEAYRKRGKKAAKARWGRHGPPGDATSNATSNATSITTSNAPSNALTDGRNERTKRTDGRSESPPLETGKIAPPEDLAQRFWFVQVGRKEDQYALAETIREMLRVGYSVEAIAAEIDRPDRDRSERFFKVKDRLERARAPTATSQVSDEARKQREREILLSRKPK